MSPYTPCGATKMSFVLIYDYSSKQLQGELSPSIRLIVALMSDKSASASVLHPLDSLPDSPPPHAAAAAPPPPAKEDHPPPCDVRPLSWSNPVTLHRESLVVQRPSSLPGALTPNRFNRMLVLELSTLPPPTWPLERDDSTCPPRSISMLPIDEMHGGGGG